jgi:hypothetical protein
MWLDGSQIDVIACDAAGPRVPIDRSRRKERTMEPWVWVIIAVAAVLLLLLLFRRGGGTGRRTVVVRRPARRRRWI